VISDHYRVPAALHRFGRRLGLLGMLLEELSAAVDRLSVLAGSPAVLQSFSSGISLASGWSLGHLYGANELECIDPLTGLVTLPVLRLRIEQVADQSAWLGIPLEQTYCVALIDVDSAGADIFEAEVAMMLIAERLKAHFNAGETIARQGSRALVLTTNSERTRTALVELLVDVRSLALPPTTRVIGWIEELSPELHDHAKVVDFLTELTI
jgi:GGDEF domain-containing protein